MGYKNVSKGVNRLDDFEGSGCIDNHLFGKLADALELDQEQRTVVRKLSLLDLGDWYRNAQEMEEMDYAVFPKNGPFRVPQLLNEEGAVDLVKTVALERKRRAWLRINRRIMFQFSADGEIEKIFEDQERIPVPVLPTSK